MKTNIIGEIGINHNGDLEIAKQLIDVACVSGCDYVKFQKRNPDVCVPEDQKNKPKSTPWGENLVRMSIKRLTLTVNRKVSSGLLPFGIKTLLTL